MKNLKLVKQSDGTFAIFGIPAAKSNPDVPAPLNIQSYGGRRKGWMSNGKAFFSVTKNDHLAITTALNFAVPPLFPGNTPANLRVWLGPNTGIDDEDEIETTDTAVNSETAPDDLPA